MRSTLSSALSVGLLLVGVGVASTAHASEVPAAIEVQRAPAAEPTPTLSLEPADSLDVAQTTQWRIDQGFGPRYTWGRRTARLGFTGAAVGLGVSGLGLGLVLGSGMNGGGLNPGLVLLVAGSLGTTASLGVLAVGTTVAMSALRLGGARVSYLPLVLSGASFLTAGLVDSRVAPVFVAASIVGVVVQSEVNRRGRDEMYMSMRPTFNLQDRSVGLQLAGRW